MNIKSISSKLTIVAIVLIHTLIWFITFLILSSNDPFGMYLSFPDFLTSRAGEYYAGLLMLTMSLTMLLACRFKFIEKLAHGLDKAYSLHKYLGYFTILLLLLHNFLIRKSNLGGEGFFIFSRSIAEPLLYVFLLAILISALPNIPVTKKIFNIPYHIWKYTHYIMGFLFLIGIYHSIGVGSFTFNNSILSIYMYIIYIIGIFSFIYKLFFYNLFVKRHKYFVKEIKIIDEDNIDVILSPKDKAFPWKPGQFAFFKFLVKGMKEIHPFSISDAENDGNMRLAIKTLGDYTKRMREEIKAGDEVLIDGPYGQFISKKEKDNEEIWIAGGIGVAPFLGIVEDYKLQNNLNKKIIFVWSVKADEDLIYKEEIKKDLPGNINFIVHNTRKLGYFKFESLKEKIENLKTVEVYVCGPESMRKSVLKSAEKIGLKNFNYEEFNFR